jgi:hypothetical protein
MNYLLPFAIALLALAACDPPRSAEPAAEQKLVAGDVALIATAPDGTKLWAVRSYGRYVYFSSTGTTNDSVLRQGLHDRCRSARSAEGPVNDLVVGTGPAGLTAAYLLAKKGERVTLVERGPEPGGLWRGFRVQHSMNIRLRTARFSPAPRPTCASRSGCTGGPTRGVPEIDAFWRGLPVERVEIPREIAGCYWKGDLQLNSPYPDVRGGKTFENAPILEKLWGMPIADLADHAGKLIKIDRVVAYDAERTAKLYDGRAREPAPVSRGRTSARCRSNTNRCARASIR